MAAKIIPFVRPPDIDDAALDEQILLDEVSDEINERLEYERAAEVLLCARCGDRTEAHDGICWRCRKGC